ncbi:alpha/beta hydrolase [Pedobacter boryungensis]|uniref:Alpha/beta hydrolase n=1 Tax=Pedobacter boryungensis TaxID=869962 RepID=A0ABX2DEV5_9SPHI|nr:alpha/beta hydrolase [Pedobacter boryungensis]NQX32515.1 alpha/beta hydrolase [Pedobacter boryungensis]
MKSISKISGVGILLLMLFIACEKVEEPAYQTKAEAQLISNLAYGNDPKQTMDVYLPPNRTSNTSVIIFIHGGSFIGGDKADFNKHAIYLAGCGYAVLNVNYRLVDGSGLTNTSLEPPHIESEIKVKDQVSDIATAVDFAIAHAKEWVVSSKRIAIAGHSAGGTLALLYSYDLRNSNKVQAVSNMAGALDLVFTNVPNWELYPKYVFEGGYRYTGFDASVANQKYYQDISPLFTANAAKKVSTLNILPENNNVMGLPNLDFATYDKFIARLEELRVPNDFLFVSGSDHNFSQSGKWQIVLDSTVAYFNKNIK